MRKRKKDAAETLFGIIQETEALAEEQPSNDINVLNELLTQFLSRAWSAEIVGEIRPAKEF